MAYPKTFIQLPDIPEQVKSASHAYEIAFSLARAGDVLGWRQLVKNIRPKVFKDLVQWRQNELDGQEPKSKEQLVQVVDRAVEIISPLMVVALAGVESGREKFRNQKSLLDDLLNVAGWNPDGCKTWVNIPNALGYVYFSLHGCVSLITNQIDLALGLARVKIPVPDGIKFLCVWEIKELRRQTPNLSGGRSANVIENWDFLAEAYKRWEWLSSIFETQLEYRTSLVAYNMALNIHELATLIDSNQQDRLNSYSSYPFNIPLTFFFEDYDITKRSASLLRRNRETLMELWTCLDVKRDQMENSWESWCRLAENQLSQLLQYRKPFNPEPLLGLTDIFQRIFEGL